MFIFYIISVPLLSKGLSPLIHLWLRQNVASTSRIAPKASRLYSGCRNLKPTQRPFWLRDGRIQQTCPIQLLLEFDHKISAFEKLI